MLKLDYGIERERKNILLGKLRTQFSKYFDFLTSGSLATNLAYSQAVGQVGNGQLTPSSATDDEVERRLSVRSDPVISKIFEIFLDSNEGANLSLLTSSSIGSTVSIKSIKDKLQEQVITTDSLSTEQIEQNIQKIKRCAVMHYARSATNGGEPSQNSKRFLKADLETIGLQNQDNDRILDRVTAFEIMHPLMVPGEKNAELLTVFFNSMPTLEMTRATPVLNIKIYSSRQVEQDGKLGAITLHKFLEGAVDIPTATNDPLRAINLASQVTASMFGDREQSFTNFSVVGLELFTAPQTLQNIEATKNKDNYLAPIIDPMRPLASIKSLEIEVRPTVGLMQTKTAKLEIILHDRSRLGEFADFVKPDRYGSSFIDLEYGWSHPDGIDLAGDEATTKNPYAQLLNLTRAKEHYGIMSSNFSFDEVGQVNITLNLYTRGSAEAGEISIANNGDVRAQVKRLEELSRQINRLSGVVFRRGNTVEQTHGNNGRTQEIRGQQMLTAASDSQNMLLLNNQLFNSLRDLRRNLGGIAAGNNNTTTEAQRNAAQQLINNLNQLVGNTNDTTHGENDNRRPEPTSAIGRVQTSINQSIHDALMEINRHDGPVSPYETDIFLVELPESVKRRLTEIGMRRTGTLSEQEGQAQLAGAEIVGTSAQTQQNSRRSRGTHRGRSTGTGNQQTAGRTGGR